MTQFCTLPPRMRSSEEVGHISQTLQLKNKKDQMGIKHTSFFFKKKKKYLLLENSFFPSPSSKQHISKASWKPQRQVKLHMSNCSTMGKVPACNSQSPPVSHPEQVNDHSSKEPKYSLASDSSRIQKRIQYVLPGYYRRHLLLPSSFYGS